MPQSFRVTLGQYSTPGQKSHNQDFHGACIPKEPQLSLKGVALALADGISSSPVSQIASQTAVKSFLNDYYCTSEAWTVRNAAERVLHAIHSWLQSQTRRSEYRFDRDRGYVCTLSALVLSAKQAHLFHVGDSRIYRVRNAALEQLTKDHRLWISHEESYLSRALGDNQALELDYQCLPLAVGDTFLLATDGVYEHADPQFILDTLQRQEADLEQAARCIAEHALARGSQDNLTLQLVRVDQLPGSESVELQRQAEQLPLPPALEPRMQFDGYTILRELHVSNRSHVFLAQDNDSGAQVVLKTPSIDLSEEQDYLERFLMEEWVARRLNSVHVLKAYAPDRPRTALYTAMEYVEGQTLRQWLVDHPQPDLETVRGLLEQIAHGLRAFHRMEMLHQDLRPDNILIDRNGTVKIIDFGATRVAGLAEAQGLDQPEPLLGTALYSAPEYFLGQPGSPRSDQFSLGVIGYQLLSGRFPYGTQVAKCRSAKAQQALRYRSVLNDDSEIPAWVDAALKRATHPNPDKRYDELSEFIHDLRHPGQTYLNQHRAPLMERNPVLFWQGISLSLSLVILFLLTQ